MTMKREFESQRSSDFLKISSRGYDNFDMSHCWEMPGKLTTD